MSPGKKKRQPYRYSTYWAGISGHGLSIQPVGMTVGQQNRFHTEINLLSRHLFGRGAALNTVYTAHSFVIFQHEDSAVNRQRAQRVMREWRRLKREGRTVFDYCKGTMCMTPQETIKTILESYLVPGKTYPQPLPEALVPWYCYTSDGGHSIVCAIKKLYTIDGTPEQFLVPVPVKTVLRGYDKQGDYVVVDLPYDEQVGLQVPPGDDEFDAF